MNSPSVSRNSRVARLWHGVPIDTRGTSATRCTHAASSAAKVIQRRIIIHGRERHRARHSSNVSWLFCLVLATTPVLKQEIVVTAERTAVPRAELTTATTVLPRKDVEALPATDFTSELLSWLRFCYTPGRGMADAFAAWIERDRGKFSREG